MRIRSLHIYGFGKWKDYSLSFNEGPLTVVMGNNEAGKSTIQQFLLFILFGLPPRKREFYQPKNGGSVGGRLTIETEENGIITVERMHDRVLGEAVCRLENGEEHGEAFLREILGGISKSVYKSIYSFNADDLNKLQGLTGDELGEVLLNVGLMGSDQLHETTKFLEKELDEQFKPKGRKPKLNQHLEKIEQLQVNRRQAELETGEYQQTLEKSESMYEEIQRIDEKLEDKRKLTGQLTQLKKAAPVLLQYHQMKNLKKPEHVMDKDALEQMRHLQENILPLENSLNDALTQLEKYREEAEYLKESLTAYPYDKAEELLQFKSEYERILEIQKRLNQQLNQLQEETDSEMTRAGISIEISAYKFPFYLEDQWREIREELTRLETALEQWNEKKNSLRLQKEQTEHQLEELKREGISEEEAERYSEKIDFYIHSQTAAASMRTNKTASFYYLGAGILFIAGCLLSLWTSEALWLFAGGIAGLGIIMYTQLQIKGNGQMPGATISNEEYNQARKQLQKFDQTKGEQLYLMENWRGVQQEEIKLKEYHKKLENRQHKLDLSMDEQYSNYPFLQNFQVEHWEKLYHILKRLHDIQQAIENTKEELTSCYRKSAAIEESLEKFFQACNWEDGQQSHVEKFSVLAEVHEQEINKVNELKKIEKESRGLTAQTENLKEKLNPLYEQRKILLQKAGAVDAEHFYKITESHRELVKEWQTKQAVIQQIHLMLSEEEQKKFNVWSSPPREAEIKSNLDKFESEIEKLKEHLSYCQNERAEAEHRLHQLENSNRLSEYNYQLESEKGTFQEEAKRWAAYKLALDVLLKTKEAYQRDYLPRVLEEATGLFSRLTAGKYSLISVEKGSGRIKVSDQQGQYFLTNELSRGTADQLYVSLRLALARVLSIEQPLPFIVDDAFVHFDNQRLHIMIELIQELAEKQQVIFFTWRQDLAEKLKAAHTILL
ncbi:ATP-binding protein [Halobacillus massiliensis]|uniref:ATP-binding protein n=1 Tax=Halobacillus massiliensis TaxID=1926286 RepID=UPI0009E2CA66|nr:AAA family ATPase [Halobacillus massiliensis]